MKVHLLDNHKESCDKNCPEHVEVFYLMGEFHVVYFHMCKRQHFYYVSALDIKEKIINGIIRRTISHKLKITDNYELVSRRRYDVNFKNKINRKKALKKSYPEINYIYKNAANTEFCIYTDTNLITNMIRSESTLNDAQLTKSHLKCYVDTYEVRSLIEQVDMLAMSNRKTFAPEIKIHMLIDEMITSINK
jgi:hypothetical protein